jgi:hypothetical protein
MVELDLVLLKIDRLLDFSNLWTGDIRPRSTSNKVIDVSAQNAYMRLLSNSLTHLESLRLVHLFVFLLTATLIHLQDIIMMGTRPIHLE